MRLRILVMSVAILAATRAGAQTQCTTLPNPVYAAGSSQFKLVFGALGTALASQATPTTIVYAGNGGCAAVAMYEAGAGLTGTATYWDATGAAQICNLPVGGTPIQIVLSDVSDVTQCPGVTTAPAGTGDILAFVQPMMFVVPAASTQPAISAELAYVLYGLGTSDVWTDSTQVFIRTNVSSTELVMGAVIQVPVAKWKGVSEASAPAMIAALNGSANPQLAIGILSSDIYDANRTTLRVLPYRHFTQNHAYWPDFSSTAFDKINVRDGHYALWGYGHLITAVDGSGNPTSPSVAAIVSALTGATPLTGYNPITAIANAHFVPLCAMQVKRSADGGPLSLFSSTAPCGCSFTAAATGSTTCAACATSSACGTGMCRFGYCEAR
jgi:hypothetical protein